MTLEVERHCVLDARVDFRAKLRLLAFPAVAPMRVLKLAGAL